MNYLDTYTGLSQIEKVKSEIVLQDFDLDEFLDQIEILIQDNNHNQARVLLYMAQSKIKYTAEQSCLANCSATDSIDFIEYVISEVESDHVNCLNIDFESEDISSKRFFYSDVSRIFNIGMENIFFAIEDRMIREGYFSKYGDWITSKERLVNLIESLDKNGFFKRRNEKGDWLEMADYYYFFVTRYFVDLSEYFDINEFIPIGEKNHIQWLKDYIVG